MRRLARIVIHEDDTTCSEYVQLGLQLLFWANFKTAFCYTRSLREQISVEANATEERNENGRNGQTVEKKRNTAENRNRQIPKTKTGSKSRDGECRRRKKKKI